MTCPYSCSLNYTGSPAPLPEEINTYLLPGDICKIMVFTSSTPPLLCPIKEPHTQTPRQDGYFEILVCHLLCQLGFPTVFLVNGPVIWQADWKWTQIWLSQPRSLAACGYLAPGMYQGILGQGLSSCWNYLFWGSSLQDFLMWHQLPQCPAVEARNWHWWD